MHFPEGLENTLFKYIYVLETNIYMVLFNSADKVEPNLVAKFQIPTYMYYGYSVIHSRLKCLGGVPVL